MEVAIQGQECWDSPVSSRDQGCGFGGPLSLEESP